MSANPSVAVLLPCLNEAATIRQVVREFRDHLPSARVYVCDNGSTDETKSEAAAAGALVLSERAAGKGNAMRRLFADVEADIYVMADGDGTYDASAAPRMVEAVKKGYDMAVAARTPTAHNSYRPGHIAGNALFSGLLRRMFGGEFTDVFSGYRAMSRRIVASFPMHATGFDVETELSVHALELGAPTCEIHTAYKGRPDGSDSKLRTFKDGWAILKTLGLLFQERRPDLLLGIPAVVCFVCAVAAAAFLSDGVDLAATGAVAAVTLGGLATAMDSLKRGRLESKRAIYMRTPTVRTDIP